MAKWQNIEVLRSNADDLTTAAEEFTQQTIAGQDKARVAEATVKLRQRLSVSKNLASNCFNVCKICKFLVGSFSAVSKPTFVSEYAFCRIFQALQDLHTSAPLETQTLFVLTCNELS